MFCNCGYINGVDIGAAAHDKGIKFNIRPFVIRQHLVSFVTTLNAWQWAKLSPVSAISINDQEIATYQTRTDGLGTAGMNFGM